VLLAGGDVEGTWELPKEFDCVKADRDPDIGDVMPAESGGADVCLDLSIDDSPAADGRLASKLFVSNDAGVASGLAVVGSDADDSEASADTLPFGSVESLVDGSVASPAASAWASAVFRLETVCMTASVPRHKNSPTAARRPIIDRVIGKRRGDSGSGIATPG
jgi:hypothetical protein